MLGWVPGHQGIEGSVKTDMVTRDGTSLNGQDPTCRISKAVAMRLDGLGRGKST